MTLYVMYAPSYATLSFFTTVSALSTMANSDLWNLAQPVTLDTIRKRNHNRQLSNAVSVLLGDMTSQEAEKHHDFRTSTDRLHHRLNESIGAQQWLDYCVEMGSQKPSGLLTPPQNDGLYQASWKTRRV